MNVVIVFVALNTLGSSTSLNTTKTFHEHFEDFVGHILAESGHEFERLMTQYSEREDFWFALNYLKSTNFTNVINEMESLPEFQAVIKFLEKDHIDVTYFLHSINELIDYIEKSTISHSIRGNALSSLIQDCINLYPKTKLAAVFAQKKEEDDAFRAAMENLQSEEWKRLYNALWENQTFQTNVQTLRENGVDVHLIIRNIKAIFGQN